MSYDRFDPIVVQEQPAETEPAPFTEDIPVTVDRFGNTLTVDDLSQMAGYSLDKTYTHTERRPTKFWLVRHNLNKYPSVTVVDSSGRVCIGEVQYHDKNKLSLIFSAGFSGTAYCN